jgi:hypothetical protein
MAPDKLRSGAFFRFRFQSLIQGNHSQPLLAQMHQHNIDGHSVQPGGKGRVAAEACNPAMQLKKNLLSQVFGFSKFS